MLPRAILQRFHNFSLRRKLILSFLAVILIGGVVSLFIGTRLEHRTIVSLAEAKVRHDLASAWMVLQRKAQRHPRRSSDSAPIRSSSAQRSGPDTSMAWLRGSRGSAGTTDWTF